MRRLTEGVDIRDIMTEKALCARNSCGPSDARAKGKKHCPEQTLNLVVNELV
jgi:hypothetical protein